MSSREYTQDEAAETPFVKILAVIAFATIMSVLFRLPTIDVTTYVCSAVGAGALILAVLVVSAERLPKLGRDLVAWARETARNPDVVRSAKIGIGLAAVMDIVVFGHDLSKGVALGAVTRTAAATFPAWVLIFSFIVFVIQHFVKMPLRDKLVFGCGWVLMGVSWWFGQFWIGLLLYTWLQAIVEGRKEKAKATKENGT